MGFKKKKCAWCKLMFEPHRPMQKVCAPKCALAMAQKKREKIEMAETRRKLEALKPLRYFLKRTESACNEYIKLRDAHLPCISCQRHHEGQYHAGHYLSVGSHPELRFHPANIHKQCQSCNTHKHGNHHGYRQGLIEKIGLKEVEWLEGPHKAGKYTREELDRIYALFKQKSKALRAGVR